MEPEGWMTLSQMSPIYIDLALWISQIKGIFVVCSQTFTLFWLRKLAVPVEISRYSFRVFVCACLFVISSIPGKSFHFPFP